MSGAETASCVAPAPQSVDALVAILSTSERQPIHYREEVHHPALVSPEIATGTMWVEPDGTLVRDQVTPRREISRVGDLLVSVQGNGAAEPTLFPVPDEMQPLIASIRLLLTGETVDSEAATLSTGRAGWRLDLAGASLSGCGASPETLETRDSSGVRRIVRFERVR